MYERRTDPPASRKRFLRRLARNALWAFLLLAVSLGIGVLGYRLLAGLGWVDSLLNAAMILGGMGPVDILHSNAAKVFASCYALYSGVALLSSMGILLTPLYHRFMHKFHFEEQ